MLEKIVALSIVGSHAGESIQEIFNRKKKEILETGKTFWLFRSNGCKPEMIQKYPNGNVLFIESSSINGSKPTIENQIAKEWSIDNINWESMNSKNITTGKVSGAYAFVFDQIEYYQSVIDLWDFSEFENIGKAIKFMLGRSTVACIENPSKDDPNKIKSHFRNTVGFGKLSWPYCVFLR